MCELISQMYQTMNWAYPVNLKTHFAVAAASQIQLIWSR